MTIRQELIRKAFACLLLTVGVWGAATAQQANGQKEPPYKLNPVLPALDLLLPDSSKLTNNALKKQNTMIMYFSPDCDHCVHQMEDMAKDRKKLASLQIVMVTHQPMESLVWFIKKYDLASYSNIRAGQDYKFNLPGFYAIRQLPYFALYDKDWKLIRTYESNTPVDTLVAAFKNGGRK